MQDVILLVSTSAIFIFGYFLMNKLDVFLENNWNRQETCRGSVADVGFDVVCYNVVCYNIEKGNRFCLSDR